MKRSVLGLALLSLAACQGRSRPDVIVVLIDTLRADHLGCYGNTESLTPFIDELAARGTLFRHAYSTSAWTFPAVASLFSSRYPQQHHVVRLDSRLGEGETTLAERLHAAHYFTGGYSAHFGVSQSLGVTQGFDEWFASPTDEVPGPTLTRTLLARLDQAGVSANRRPCFLYAHYLEPHGPYEPRRPFRDRFLRPEDAALAAEANTKVKQMRTGALGAQEVQLLAALYDGEVATVDAELRTLFGELERRGLLTNAVIVVTADHGEEFREHGGMGHGTSLYNELIHIPLIILAPGYAPGHTVEENVSLVDVAPTLLDLSGLASESQFEGRSLVPFMKGTPANEPPRDVIVQLESSGARIELRRHTLGIIRGATKLLLRPSGETDVYDLANDPEEKQPNPASLDVSKPTLQAGLDEAEAGLRRRAASEVVTAPLDEATSEHLRNLGYQTNF